jgi:aminopeptidase N
VPSLKKSEAEARAEIVRSVDYEVRLDVRPAGLDFGSITTIRFGAVPGAQTFVEVRPARLRSATLNGSVLDIDAAFSATDGRLRLRELQEQNELVVDAEMTYSHDGEGLVRHVDPGDGQVYVYAMSFLDAAPRWFACFDQPDLKGPFALAVSCPAEWTVAGNGPAVQVGPGEWTIRQPHPVATYMTTLLAGPYHSIRGEHDGIPLVLHTRAALAPALERDATALLAHTARCFDEFHHLFGVRYPWGEYHQAFVPDFNAGAMENPGCVTLRDQLVFRWRAASAELV